MGGKDHRLLLRFSKCSVSISYYYLEPLPMSGPGDTDESDTALALQELRAGAGGWGYRQVNKCDKHHKYQNRDNRALRRAGCWKRCHRAPILGLRLTGYSGGCQTDRHMRQNEWEQKKDSPCPHHYETSFLIQKIKYIHKKHWKDREANENNSLLVKQCKHFGIRVSRSLSRQWDALWWMVCTCNVTQMGLPQCTGAMKDAGVLPGGCRGSGQLGQRWGSGEIMKPAQSVSYPSATTYKLCDLKQVT